MAGNSKLDGNQVLGRAFDDTTDRVRVDSLVTATIGTVDVVVDAVGGDNIAIKNSVSGNQLAVNADGSINVTEAAITNGNQKAIVRGGTKGITTAADVTSTSQSVDRNALDVQIRTSAGVVVDTFGGGTQYTEGATQASPIGTAAMARTAANLVKSLKLDASDNLLVNVAAGGTAGQQYADGTARGTATGTLLMVDDGTLIQSALGTAAGVLKIDISATTANATAIKTDNSAVTQPISAVSLPLPTGAATSALQTTQDTSINTLLKPASTLAAVTTVSAVTSITNALPAGANLLGKVGIDQTVQGTTNKVAISDSLGNAVSAFPATFLRTTDEPHQLFYDAFDSTLDTTDRWTSTSGSSGVAAANSLGVMSMGTGTVANGYAKLTSQPTFTLPIPAWLGASDAIALPDGAAPIANSYRYWGTGTTPATPSVATPVTDGYGFELNTDGKLRAVVYAGGVRTIIQDLSVSGNNTQPLDAAYHRYIIYIRTDKTYFYIDGLSSAQLVATTNFQSSQVQALPRLFLTIGNATPPVSNVQIQSSGAATWDTGKNNTQISDSTFQWRKVTVKAASTASITTDLPMVVAHHPSSPTPTGANLIGKVGIDQTVVGSTNAVSLAQVGATVVATGNGVVGAGVQRVSIASDNTPYAVNATLAAETTKVIGTINLSAAQTLATVTTVGAVTAITNALPTGANVIGQVTANSGTNLNTSLLNLEATQVKLTLAQASTTAGQSGALVQGAVTTNAPTYTTAQTSPLSLDILGNLRISNADILTASTNITTQNLVPAGTATAGSAVLSGTLQGHTSGMANILGTYTGALSLQGAVDITTPTWITIGGTPLYNVNTAVYSATIPSAAVGVYQFDVAGFAQFRITGLAAMTGTASVTLRLSVGTSIVSLDTSLPAGTNTIGKVGIDQTTPGTTNAVSIAQIGAATVLTGNGVSGTGVQRTVAAREQTHRASTIIPLVVAITANVPFLNIIGSASRTVIIKKITISGATQTAVGYFPINVEKLSTASTLGTSTILVATTHDTNNTAVTAVVKAYTVGGTKGALVGTLASRRILWQATVATASVPDNYTFSFADTIGSGGIVLRGVAQELALTFPVALATAGTLSIDIEWTEEV